jgi:hypothetical protein
MATSDRLITNYLRNKYQAALSLVKHELPGMHFKWQPR